MAGPTKADLEVRIAELEAELAKVATVDIVVDESGDDFASPSGRTTGVLTISADGSVLFTLARDSRTVHRFDLGREVLNQGRDPEHPDGE